MTAPIRVVTALHRAAPGLFLLACLLIAARAGAATNATKLVVLDSRDFGDTNFLMRIEELERHEKTSLLRLTHEKMGSSVGSSMFIAQGFYLVAKARGAEYFANLKEWEDGEGGRLYIAGFTRNKDADIPQEFGAEFSTTNEFGQERTLLSVAMYDLLWGRKKP